MKHSKIISAAVLCLACSGAMAQSISKSVVASAGGSYSGSTMKVDYTIGQSVTNYSATSSYMVTEGFHPIAESTVPTEAPVTKTVANGLSVKAFPNPVSSMLHISVQQNTAEPLSLNITDVTGKTVKAMQFDAQLNTDASIDLSALVAGMYYIVVNPGKENAQVMKIVKN